MPDSNSGLASRLAEAITNSDRLQAGEVEARELLGLDGDAVLAPAEALRVQVVAALRTVITDQLGGKAVDPARLLASAEALTKLLPPAPPPPQQEQRRHVGARERLAALIAGHAEAHRDEQAEIIAQQSAEIERLQAALNQRADAAQPIEGEILPPAPKAAPAPTLPVGTAAAHVNEQNWRPPASWTKSGQPTEPWRDFVVGPDSKRQWWGPV
jgi:hypothetical protein